MDVIGERAGVVGGAGWRGVPTNFFSFPAYIFFCCFTVFDTAPFLIGFDSKRTLPGPEMKKENNICLPEIRLFI